MAGVSSVMWSHNLDNDTYACNNNKTLNDIMKHKFGFQGCTSYFGQNLTDFVMNSAISMQRLDDMVKRIIAAWYFLHQEEGYPNVTVSSFNFYNPLIRSSSKEGRRPPVRKPKSIILVGSDAGTNNFTYLILSPPTKPFKHAPEWIRPVFSGTSMTGISPMQATPSLAWRPLLFLLAPTRGYVTVDGNAAYSSIAAQNNNTIVVTNSGSFDHRIEPWVDHPNVTIVWANLGGKEAGNAITDILYGACVYIAKQGNSHSDVTTCFNSLKKVMQEFRSMAASEAQLQMAQSSMRPSAVTLTTDPGAAFAVDFDAMVANWDEYPNIGNDKGGAEEGSSDDEYDPNAKILKGKGKLVDRLTMGSTGPNPKPFTCSIDTQLDAYTLLSQKSYPSGKQIDESGPDSAAVVRFSPVQRVEDENQEPNHGPVLQNRRTQNWTLANGSERSGSVFLGFELEPNPKKFQCGCGYGLFVVRACGQVLRGRRWEEGCGKWVVDFC
ncbi:hypothetical protein BDR05DRAFT_1031296 [Suillus weaverae]|nr:hypothetical protein BDR05DRAFT_1031296 [Suillus weaverae]